MLPVVLSGDRQQRVRGVNTRVGSVEWAALGVQRAWNGHVEQERMLRVVWPALGDALDTLDETVASALKHEP